MRTIYPLFSEGDSVWLSFLWQGAVNLVHNHLSYKQIKTHRFRPNTQLAHYDTAKYSAMQRQTAVTAYLKSKQSLLFGFAWQYSTVDTVLRSISVSTIVSWSLQAWGCDLLSPRANIKWNRIKMMSTTISIGLYKYIVLAINNITS